MTTTAAQLKGDREMIATRVFDAPRKLVFKVWTDPKHLAQWWGPNGFVTTTFKQEVKPGGTWRFVMHGPDGRDYENKVTYLEVDSPNRLVFKHGGEKDVEPVNHKTTAVFESIGNKTKVTMLLEFASPSARDFVMKEYNVLDGMTQTMNHLAEHLAVVGTPDEAFVITRVFDAPRSLVWDAWTKKEHMVKWFGPKGFTTTHATLDFRPGGNFHYCMRGPDGKDMWGKAYYKEIIPPQRVVLVQTFSDEKGGLGRHPMAPDWPREMLNTTTFAEHEGKTTIAVRWQPLNPTEAERNMFHAGRAGMTGGWTGTFEQLDEYLKTLKS